jgi:hypothetical protein
MFRGLGERLYNACRAVIVWRGTPLIPVVALAVILSMFPVQKGNSGHSEGDAQTQNKQAVSNEPRINGHYDAVGNLTIVLSPPGKPHTTNETSVPNHDRYQCDDRRCGFVAIAFRYIDLHNGFFNTLFGFFVAVFTGLLYFVTNRQVSLTSRQVDLAREEFVATHRPILRVRRIWPIGKSEFLGNISTEVRIIVANIGQSEAKIASLSSNVIFERKKAKRAEFQADSATSDYSNGPIVVPPGKQGIINVFSTLDITPGTYNGERGTQYEVMAIGVIEYEDRMGGGYVTGFARMYDPTSNRFRVVADDDPEADREYVN